MTKYVVQYAHDNENASDVDAKYGWGEIKVETDAPIETQEHLKELARTIGLQAGYTTVGIIKLTEIEDDEEFDIVGGNDDRTTD